MCVVCEVKKIILRYKIIKNNKKVYNFESYFFYQKVIIYILLDENYFQFISF